MMWRLPLLRSLKADESLLIVLESNQLLASEHYVRNGFKIYDTDTHIGPSAETIRPYFSSLVLERIPDLDEHRTPIRMSVTREPLQPPYRHSYRFRGDG